MDWHALGTYVLQGGTWELKKTKAGELCRPQEGKYMVVVPEAVQGI